MKLQIIRKILLKKIIQLIKNIEHQFQFFKNFYNKGNKLNRNEI